MALLTSKGLEEQEVQSGWGLDMDMKLGLKKRRESLEVASCLSASCQESITFSLTRDLKAAFEGGWESKWRGEGRL